METISGVASRTCSELGGRSGVRDAGRGFCARSTSRSSMRATAHRERSLVNCSARAA